MGCFRGLFGIGRFTLLPLRFLHTKKELEAATAGMPAFRQRERQMFLGFAPVVGLEMSLAFDAIQVPFSVPFRHDRRHPGGKTDSKPEDASDTDH